MLTIARGLKLPLEAITQTFGILAVRGAGKTYTGAVIAEEMIATGMPVVIADPIGVWWGLRSEFPVVIFGGDHGDVPLETGADLLSYWKGKLGKAERTILETLYEAYPNCLTKEEVAVRTDYSVGGGGFNNALSKLRTLELIEGRGTLTAGEVFFE